MTMLPLYYLLLISGPLVLGFQSNTKLTLTQKNAANTKSNRDIQTNTIPGSSDYVPESQLVNMTTQASNVTNSVTNTTRSEANVFQALSPNGNTTDKDPMISNAQSPNPFLSGMPGGGASGGGINPQIAMILRNNPRLQMLARQNPIVAQQIMQNPGLLRDPQVQRAIQSQLGPGGSQNLLSQLGQAGLLNSLGRALNPFGLPINPLMGQQGGNMGNTGNRNRLNQNALGQGLGQGQGGMNNFGLPRNQQRNQHSNALPGGYYGNNGNYGNPNTGQGSNDNNSEGDVGEDENGGEGEASPDYDGTGGGGEENGNAGDDSQQNPAEDPDIQQLQNFGGPINDNFPEGLFPPGLLTKEDIEEIRKQQEKQQREAEEKERQQQSQQNGGEQNPDYDYGNTGEGEDGEAGGGEDGTTEGAHTAGAEDNQIDHGQEVSTANPQHHSTHQQQPMLHNNGYVTPRPTAYQNSYQPVQPQAPPRVPIHPQINYANDYPTLGKNTFNYQPKVEYDQPQQNHGYPVSQYMTTHAPPVQHQNNRMPYQQQPYRGQNSGIQYPSQPYQPRSQQYRYGPEQPRQYHRPWQSGPRQYDNAIQTGPRYPYQADRPMVYNEEDDQYRHSTPPQPYHYAHNHNQPPSIPNQPIFPQRPSTPFA